MLAKPLAACTYLSFNSFRVIPCLSQCVSPKIVILPHFCFPWRRPWGNHAKCYMDGTEFDAYKLSRIMYSSIFNSFPAIRTTNAKKRRFHLPQPTFPWRRPCDYHATCCMGGKTIQCLPNPCSIYLSIFNSFRVIRCLSQCLSPKIAIFTTFLFPLETPLRLSRNMLHGWKDNSMLAKPSQHIPIYLQ